MTHTQSNVIIELVNDTIMSLWADHPIDFTILPDQQGYTIAGGSGVRLWFSADPEMPQYDPVAEGLTKYYPI